MIPVSGSPYPSASSRRNGGPEQGPSPRSYYVGAEPPQVHQTTRTDAIPPPANAIIEVSVLGRGCKCRKALLGS